MSNKHTKIKKKTTIEQFMRAQITRIKAAVPGMKVTIVARFPMDPDAEIVFTDENKDGGIWRIGYDQHYRSLAYVKNECRSLAQQLAALSDQPTRQEDVTGGA